MPIQKYFLDGRFLVSGERGHLRLGYPISLTEILTNAYPLVPALQANPYNFSNGITATPNIVAGTDVVLGGALLNNTILDGNNTYSFNFQDLSQLDVSVLNDISAQSDNLNLTIGDSWIASVTDILNFGANSFVFESLGYYNNVNGLLENDAFVYNTEVSEQFIFTNNVFSTCRNITNTVNSSLVINSYQLGSFEGFEAVMRGVEQIESPVTPPALVDLQVESGLYITNKIQDECTPATFINSIYKTDEIGGREASSLVSIRPDFTEIKVKEDLDVENAESTSSFKAGLISLDVNDIVTDYQATIELTSQDIAIKTRSGLNDYDYRLPSLENPNSGDIIVMNGVRKGKFAESEIHIQGTVATFTAGDRVFFMLPFNSARVNYRLKRVSIFGQNGTVGDEINIAIADKEGNPLTTAPVNVELLVNDFSTLDTSFFSSYTESPNLSNVVHLISVLPQYIYLQSPIASIANTSWNNVIFILTFEMFF